MIADYTEISSIGCNQPYNAVQARHTTDGQYNTEVQYSDQNYHYKLETVSCDNSAIIELFSPAPVTSTTQTTIDKL